MPTIEELGRLVKAKYPQYQNLSDSEVGRRVKAKYPGAYDQFEEVKPEPAFRQAIGMQPKPKVQAPKPQGMSLTEAAKILTSKPRNAQEAKAKQDFITRTTAVNIPSKPTLREEIDQVTANVAQTVLNTPIIGPVLRAGGQLSMPAKIARDVAGPEKAAQVGQMVSEMVAGAPAMPLSTWASAGELIDPKADAQTKLWAALDVGGDLILAGIGKLGSKIAKPLIKTFKEARAAKDVSKMAKVLDEAERLGAEVRAPQFDLGPANNKVQNFQPQADPNYSPGTTPNIREGLQETPKGAAVSEGSGPTKVFHGTVTPYEGAPQVISGRAGNAYGRGIYFTDDPARAYYNTPESQSGSRVFSGTLKWRNPFKVILNQDEPVSLLSMVKHEVDPNNPGNIRLREERAIDDAVITKYKEWADHSVKKSFNYDVSSFLASKGHDGVWLTMPEGQLVPTPGGAKPSGKVYNEYVVFNADDFQPLGKAGWAAASDSVDEMAATPIDNFLKGSKSPTTGKQAEAPKVEPPKTETPSAEPPVDNPLPSGINRADRVKQAGELGTEMPVSIGGESLEDLAKKGKSMLDDGFDAEAVIRDLAAQGRAPKPEETAGIAAYRQNLLEELQGYNKKLDSDLSPDERAATVQLKEALFDKIADFDRNLDEVKGAAGRSLGSFRIGQTVNWSDVDEVLLEAKRIQGRDLAPKEVQRLRAEVEKLNADVAAKEAKLADLQKAKAEAVANQFFGQSKSRKRTVEAIRAERTEAANRIREKLRESLGSAGSGIDPTKVAEIAKDVALVLKTLIEEFAVKSLDELTTVFKREMPDVDLTDDDLRRVLAGMYDAETAPRVKSDLSRIKAEARDATKAAGESLKKPGQAAREARRKDAREILGRAAKSQDLDEQLATGTPIVPSKKVRQISREAELMDLDIQLKQKRLNAMVRAKAENAVRKGVREVAGTVRMLQLGADFGALLRQGLFTVTSPRIAAKGVKNAVRAIRSDADMFAVEQALRQKEIRGKLVEPLRRRAGLSRSDSITDPEEAFIARWFKMVPGLRSLSGVLERGQAAYLNTIRNEMFDSLVARHADVTEKELQDWANYINSATGRSATFGARRDVPDLLATVMTSPRYEASRWEMVGNYLKAATGPTAIKAIKKDRAARAQLINLGSTAATVYGALKIAEAAGAEVDFDPTSADFFKIRIGDRVFDPTAGMSPRIRTAARIAMNVLEKDQGFGRNPAAEAGKAVARSISPSISTPYSFITGTTLAGFEDDEKGWMALTPLILQGFVETKEKEGLGAAMGQAGVEFVGVGASRYPKPKPRQ